MNRLIFIITTIVILFLSSIAFSESAWVLWIKHDSLLFKKGKEGLLPEQKIWWELQVAVPKYEQCLQVLEKIWKLKTDRYKDHREYPGIEKVEGTTGIIITSFKNNVGSLSETFYCLPETVDPTRSE